MSGQITLNKQNGGQLTLEPENNAVNKTITIPDVGVGKILQVKTDTASSTISTTSTSYVATGLSLNITPTATNSTFLVFVSHQIRNEDSSGNVDIFTKIKKDSTSIYHGVVRFSGTNNNYSHFPTTETVTFTTGSTSAVTVGVDTKVSANAATNRWHDGGINDPSPIATLTVMEVAG